VDARVENPEAAGLPDPLLLRMPFVHVLVPVDLHRLDALARERLCGGVCGRMVLRVPCREQANALRLGEAVEVGDLGQPRGRRLFEQAVEAGLDALACDRVARAGRGGDRNRFETLDASDQLAPVGELSADALARAARA